MASSLAMGGTLRHLRDLFSDGTTVGLGDGQLLARYAAARDEAAFAALVARHGPMVLATCRAVLRHDHDVEDAFQATFLVLAKKARSVRAGDALGGWLHRVAYRVSVQASADARRRRRREAEASAMTSLHTEPTGPEPDVAAIVHEEVDRLPEKHRLPVVLCDLEGLTYEQAAGRLRWTVPALRCRLARARQQLHGRLTRRGLTAGALGIVLAGSTAGARAAVPPALARAAVTAATGGTASATAAALAATLIRTMAMTRLTIAAAGLVAAAALVSIGSVVIGSWRPERPGAAPIPQAVGEMKRPAPARDDAPAPASAPVEMVEVRGRVVAPDGKPAAGATVRTAYIDLEIDPAPEATSARDGRFTLMVPPWRRNSAMRQADAMFPWVVASAPGFGPGWASAVRPPGATDETTIRLVEDGPPIEGRIVDLQGRPVVGARVKVEHIWFDREGRLAAWLDRAGARGVRGPWQGLDQLPATIEATTGPDGRFRLAGIGRDRLAELIVSGPTIATAQLYVANRDGTAIRAANPDAMIAPPAWTTYHTRRFDYAAEPTQPIEGVVRDKDTGRPIAGAKLRGMVFEEHSLVRAPGIEATTDAQGHYRLTGLPKAPAYRLFLEPGRGQPYTNGTFRTPGGSPALEPVAFDVALKRGVLVRGKVTDKATGRPVAGYVNAYAFADNPHVGEFPGYRSSYEPYTRIEDDGRYEVVTLPGRGLIACRSDLGRYRGGVGAASIRGHDPKIFPGLGGFATLPHNCHVADYHVLAEVNPAPGAESTTLDLQVDPGRSLTIHAVDPEGDPLAGTKASGLTDLFSTIVYEQDSPTIEAHALDPSKPRRVTLTHEGRKLVASLYLKGDEAGPLTVRLQPSGTVTGRILDEDGRPRSGLTLTNLGGIYPEPPADRAILPIGNTSMGIPVDRDGRFRVEGLVPGLKYGAGAVGGSMGLGEVFRDLTVAPGEFKDLGDVKIVPRKPGN
jgi:RNA polymerase sigma factor (sigma-70 family)